MDYIQIPLPNFNFSDVVIAKARETASLNISLNDIMCNLSSIRNSRINVLSQAIEDFNSLNDNGEKLIYINELFLHISKIQQEAKRPTQSMINLGIDSHFKGLSNDEGFIRYINEIKYNLYQLLRSTGYNLDTNAFNENEINGLGQKIDLIINKLNEIQTGQEVIFDDLSELKSDFESLKTDFLLGKKRWYQRLLGISVSYAGEKGADAILEQLKPLLHDFFVKNVPHILDRL